jgi:hypothetical protein
MSAGNKEMIISQDKQRIISVKITVGAKIALRDTENI